MEDLPNIFTKINIQILELLAKERLHIRQIAERIKCSPAKVHACIQVFKKNGIVKEVDEKNRKVIVLNLESELTKNILGIINIDKRIEGPYLVPEKISLFDAISPLDFRYYGRNKKIYEKLQPYLSEAAFIKYALKVECALTRVLAKNRICPQKAAGEVENACRQVTPEQVYAEEDRIKHNIRALANCIRNKVSEEAKPFVHFTSTSYDIIATADAARYKDFANNVLLPELLNLQSTLINLALREKSTVQIGRTHGQHAEPITFGFAIAQYVSRLGSSILRVKKTANNLRGKMSGAVGAYNASSLFFNEPVKFEKEVLQEMDLKPSPASTQVVEAEFFVDFLNSVISAFGVLANLADDMRHLQRNEIAEVGEYFEARQVGSSTMPQKRNPINFENVKSMWKEFMPRMTTMYMDQLSEHQRDLTNSASMRFIPEMLAGFYISIARLEKVMSSLVVDKDNIKRNFDMTKKMIVAEPLYILLAANGHPDAHEYVREKTLESQLTKKPLIQLVKEDKSIQPFLKRFSKKQLEIINNPEKYTGIAEKKAEEICGLWKKELKL
ncbi:winged helix-turn-helix transcriptional regulator [Candidatus Woesearchaeota archaeon]|nr:winged helix-turn-helix transcriptional regulator [Candidatus Woesearchaeota archaeon]